MSSEICGPLTSHLSDPQAKTLHQAVLDKYQCLRLTHDSLNEALALAGDIESRSDGELLIRQQGQKYRAAIQSYCDAVAAWLIFADTFEEDI